MKEISVALVGNPNVGKTSLYNRLTKSAEKVGNWHGVTVSEVNKKVKFNDAIVSITDLPGLYSLTAYTPEEEITRNGVLYEKREVIVCVCEVNNLRRNLYLTMQLIELGLPVVVVVNMMDELYKRGKTLDGETLSNRLGVPVFLTSAKSKGCEKDLLAVIEKRANGNAFIRQHPPYLEILPLEKVKKIIGENAKRSGLDLQYLAIKALENDEYVLSRLDLSERQLKELNSLGDLQASLATARYDYLEKVTCGIISDTGKKKRKKIHLDKILLNRYLALPIFLLAMLLAFYLTFSLIGPFFSSLTERMLDYLLYNPAKRLLTSASVPNFVVGLVCEGIISGLTGVVVFLPQIILLFFFLAIMEDSGYASRLAFMTDGLFAKIGLSGRSVFTMLMGFGCSASAVLTSRTLENEKTRIKTVMLTPYMSCSARLPVYTVIVGAYFTGGKTLLIFSLYVLGVVVALLIAKLLQSNASPLKSEKSSFIMEIPPYRTVTTERIRQLIWHNVKTFLLRIGTIVFALNVIVWVLSNFSFTSGYVNDSSKSILASVSGVVAPLFTPLGFGSWKAVTALVSGVVAKELVVTTVESIGGVTSIFTGAYPQVSALAFCVFTLLYIPCIATLVAQTKEIGIKWTAISAFLQLVVAYSVSLIVRTLGLVVILYGSIALSVLIVGAVVAVIAWVFLSRRLNNCKNCTKCVKDCGKKGIVSK